MKEIFDKITSYNLFNYLLPGILFAFIATKISEIKLVQEDVIIGLFLYYFIGLVISRVGSLIIEPILKKMKFLNYANYSDFIKASEKDKKIEVLSEANNMYRTFLSMFILVLLLKMYDYFASKWLVLQENGLLLLIILILLIFLFSYRKQSIYVNKRIKANIKV